MFNLWIQLERTGILKILTVPIHEHGTSLYLFGSPLISLIKVLYSFPGGSLVKNTLTSAGDTRDSGLIPGVGKIP